MVGVDTVRQEPLRQTVPILGRLVPTRSVTVSAQVDGPVATVLVMAGDRVQDGAPLAHIDDALKRAELARRDAELALARARVRTAETRLTLAAQELARLRRLAGTAAFPKARFEDQRQEVARAESEIAEARAAVDRAAAERRIAASELERTVVRAPFPGVVTRRHVSPGAYARPGEPIVSLLDDRTMEVEADVPGERLAGLRPGQTVGLRVGDGSRLSSRVRAIIPSENPLTRTRPVRIALPPELASRVSSALAANQTVTVEVPVGLPREVVSVHKDAVLHRRGRELVFVVREGTAELRPVELGEAVGGRFVVLGGLRPGDQVVVRGNERLRPGQKVRPREGA